MVGKRVVFDDEIWNAINLLRQERRAVSRSSPNKRFHDFLEKHDRPVTLQAQLKASTGDAALKSRAGGHRKRPTRPARATAAAARPPRE